MFGADGISVVPISATILLDFLPSIIEVASAAETASRDNPATTGIPTYDVSKGAWLPSTGSGLYATLDETPYSDADYMYSLAAGSTCQIDLSETAYPPSSTVILKYRAMANGANGGLTVTLKQGGTTIASWSHSVASTMTEYQQTLTAPQIAAMVAGHVSVVFLSTA